MSLRRGAGKPLQPAKTATGASGSGTAAAAAASSKGKEASADPAIAERLADQEATLKTCLDRMAEYDQKLLAVTAEKDAQIQQLQQEKQQEAQARQQAQQEAERLREANARLSQRVATLEGRPGARQQPQQQQQQQHVLQQNLAQQLEEIKQQLQQLQRAHMDLQETRARQRDSSSKNVVVTGAEAADKDTLLAGVSAAAGLAPDAVEDARRSGPVWVVSLRTEAAAKQVLEARAAITQASQEQQQQGEDGQQQDGATQQQQQQQRQQGWRVRPDRSRAERQARREHQELLYRLYCAGARPRVHADGQVYVKQKDGQGVAIVPHSAWDPAKRLDDSRHMEPQSPRAHNGSG